MTFYCEVSGLNWMLNQVYSEHVTALDQDNKPVSVSTPPVTVHGSFPNSSYAFRTLQWFNLAREDVLRLCIIPPLTSLLVALVVRRTRLEVSLGSVKST
jgi:hypothetical protein